MAASPRFKVYDRDGQYQAACKEPEAAAALLGAIYQGGTVRYGHSAVIFTDGSSDGNAGIVSKRIIPDRFVEWREESIDCAGCGRGQGGPRFHRDEGAEEWIEEERTELAKEGWADRLAKVGEACDCADCPGGTWEYHERSGTKRIPGYVVVRCDCGREVYCAGFTTTCDCGADYNWNGSRLAPRSQWGEETGETLADILGPIEEELC